MKTKNLDKQEAIKKLQVLTKRVEFNNELKKEVRKVIKENPDVLNITEVKADGTKIVRQVNGYWDAPNEKMFNVVKEFIEKHGAFMDNHLKKEYLKDAAAIFAGVYSLATNTYILKDIKDLEKYINMLDSNELLTEEETQQIDGATIKRENGRLNINFGGRVEKEVYTILKHNGFNWSPSYNEFTRQLTPNAESSLLRVIEALKKLNVAEV